MSGPAPYRDGCEVSGGWRRLADLTYLRAGRLLVAAAALALVTIPATLGVFGAVDPFDISNQASESVRASERFGELTGERADAEVILLVAGGEAEAERVAAELESVAGISRTITSDRDPRLYDRDSSQALVLGVLEAPGSDLPAVGAAAEDAFAGEPGVVVGGSAVALHQISEQAENDVRTIEVFAAPVLILLLLVIFRSVVAATLTAVVGVFSILLTLAAVRGLASIGDVDLFSLQVITGLGAGLAIDYSLFMITRYRIELARGGGFRAAQLRTVAIAGRTVATSALTVAAAMLALAVFPEPFLRSTGIAAGIVALLAGFTAVVLLPAALALLGPLVEAGSVRSRPAGSGRGELFWSRAARAAMRRPLPVAAIGIGAALTLALPALGGQIVSANASSLPDGDSAHRVAAVIGRDFERLPTTTLVVVPPSGIDAQAPEVASTRAAIAAEADIRFRPIRVPGHGVAAIAAETDVDPISTAGGMFVEEIRSAPWPPGTTIGGVAAEQADERDSIGDRAPLAILLVVMISVFMVLQLLRSWLLALVAVFMNLLTVAASYGLVVAIFTGELIPDLLGFDAQPGIDASVPVLTFAVVFGLSTDYGIFLFSAIAEARANGARHEDAIAAGVGQTGRVITAAALLFALAIGAFVFSDLFIVKEFAVAISLAVILDATVMRGLIAPSALKLIGDRVWSQGSEARNRMYAARPMRIGEGG